jgi:Zn-dependent M28 family amino/carboxypeptidase
MIRPFRRGTSLLAALLLAVPALAQQRVDAERLLEDVTFLAAPERAGREPETPGSRQARAFVEARFRELGLATFGDGYVHPFTFTHGADPATRIGANVVGYIPGTGHPERYIVVTAHFDHLGVRNGQIFHGADDNASGTAGMMAAAAYFAAHRPRHSILFVAFDAEEWGMGGSRTFVARPPVPRERMVLNVNLDMISRSEANELYAAGTYHTPALRAPLERAAAGAPIALRFGHDDPALGRDQDWTHQSDHYAFHQAGIPFVYFGVEDHPDYHRPTDVVENIDPVFHARAVDLVIRSIEALDRSLAECAAP